MAYADDINLIDDAISTTAKTADMLLNACMSIG
jgi:hypothetical protein